jgi:hypothetical protein
VLFQQICSLYLLHHFIILILFKNYVDQVPGNSGLMKIKRKRGLIPLSEQIPIMRRYGMGEVHLIHFAICDKKGKAIIVTGHRPIGLRDVEALIFSRQSAHMWQCGCQAYMPAALYLQKYSWYSFLLET